MDDIQRDALNSIPDDFIGLVTEENKISNRNYLQFIHGNKSSWLFIHIYLTLFKLEVGIENLNTGEIWMTAHEKPLPSFIDDWSIIGVGLYIPTYCDVRDTSGGCIDWIDDLPNIHEKHSLVPLCDFLRYAGEHGKPTHDNLNKFFRNKADKDTFLKHIKDVRTPTHITTRWDKFKQLDFLPPNIDREVFEKDERKAEIDRLNSMLAGPSLKTLFQLRLMEAERGSSNHSA